MIEHRLIVDFETHLPLIATNGLPIQFVISDFVDYSGLVMLDTSPSLAIDVHTFSLGPAYISA
jgi:hypothetical protein